MSGFLSGFFEHNTAEPQPNQPVFHHEDARGSDIREYEHSHYSHLHAFRFFMVHSGLLCLRIFWHAPRENVREKQEVDVWLYEVQNIEFRMQKKVRSKFSATTPGSTD